MLAAETLYLEEAIRAHVHRFFTDMARVAFESVPLRWCSMEEAAHPEEAGLFIPTDVAPGVVPGNVWKVPFGATRLTLWNALPPPSNEWRLQDPSAPLWYVHPCGAVMPVWNLAPTLFDLLALKEETSCPDRDEHGRFVGRMSPRAEAGLLESPIFNDSVAALVAACMGLQKSGVPDATLAAGMVAPPVLVLSHDLDQLKGNDFWTQVVRLSRAFLPRGRSFPQMRNAWLALVNTVLPRRYYFDNIVGMIAIERMLGFTSSLYFLNGTGGRFGARSGSELISSVSALTPIGWDLGVHYNYDTHLEPEAFTAQCAELEALLGWRVVAGRAHYLRFDPARSWHFYVDMSILADESLGYYDRIGYRAGIAGPFRPYDAESEQALPLVEMPMVFMEGTLVKQYPSDPAAAFERHLRHISVVGGAVSLLFHPGQFNNPEHPETLGLYRRLLGCARQLGVRSVNARDL
ncbi:hypothetical protein C5F52_02140 [Limnohabitans sp. TS-CS-82]|uniref:hypothetical protein n=1 Tax=Limnohabitans sp. TS-CS-82 TaxID=2094193 RepID=UPI000CF255DF|nr:hypothetical protein [Limnohabitans sp. TS-CS-82]PQA84824.1 hypothetical protein C5F52_02140 [Limnohabitans sp. TS-CS-82]